MTKEYRTNRFTVSFTDSEMELINATIMADSKNYPALASMTEEELINAVGSKKMLMSMGLIDQAPSHFFRVAAIKLAKERMNAKIEKQTTVELIEVCHKHHLFIDLNFIDANYNPAWRIFGNIYNLVDYNTKYRRFSIDSDKWCYRYIIVHNMETDTYHPDNVYFKGEDLRNRQSSLVDDLLDVNGNNVHYDFDGYVSEGHKGIKQPEEIFNPETLAKFNRRIDAVNKFMNVQCETFEDAVLALDELYKID